jgi:hypothetical protein
MSENSEGKDAKKKTEWKPDEKLTMEIKKGMDWKPDNRLTMTLKEGIEKKKTEKEK